MLQVSAVDPECGKNVGVKYSMGGAAYPDVFSVDAATGQLCIAKPLDYESNPSYNFMIKASDSGEQLLTNVMYQDKPEVNILYLVRNGFFNGVFNPVSAELDTGTALQGICGCHQHGES